MSAQFAGLGDLAVALHELYASLCQAGFTEAQALYLVGKHVEGNARTSA